MTWDENVVWKSGEDGPVFIPIGLTGYSHFIGADVTKRQ